MKAVGLFARGGCFLLRGKQGECQRPHSSNQRGRESLITKFRQLDVTIRDCLAQPNPSRPLEWLGKRHRPRDTFGAQARSTHGFLAEVTAQFRLTRLPGSFASL